MNKYDEEIVKKVFDKLEGPTKRVRVRVSAFTRVEWGTEVDVPESATDDQLDDLARAFYDNVDGGEYADDPDYWERGSCIAEEVEKPWPKKIAMKCEGCECVTEMVRVDTVADKLPRYECSCGIQHEFEGSYEDFEEKS